MRQLHVALLHHRILKRCIYSFMAEKLLQLLDRHSLVNCLRSECPPKLVRMHLLDVQTLSDFPDAGLNSSDRQSRMRSLQSDEQCLAIITPAVQILLQMYLRAGVKVYDPLLVTLPEHLALPFVEVDIRLVQQHQFTTRIPVEASISINARSRFSSQLSRIFSKSSSE